MRSKEQDGAIIGFFDRLSAESLGKRVLSQNLTQITGDRMFDGYWFSVKVYRIQQEQQPGLTISFPSCFSKSRSRN